MPIPIGPPPPPVEAAVQLWNGMGCFWHGCDGSTWDLGSVDSGVVITPDGMKGLGLPTFDRYTTVSGLPGSRYRGSRTQDRKVLWPILIYGYSSQQWLDRDRALFASMRPDEFGTWEIIAVDGQSRFLDLWLVDDNDKSFGIDPNLVGWSAYGIDLIADERPYWYGPLVERQFGVPANVAFFMTSGGVFNISSGQNTSSATIPNPGDVDAWPLWTVANGHGGVELAVGTGSVILPAMSNGDVWTVDTRPEEQSVTDAAGVDHTDEVTWNPAPVPRGTEVALTITVTSPDPSATIKCSIKPQYLRAW